MNPKKIVSRRTGDKQIANLKYILGIKVRDSGYFWYDTGDACIHLKKFLYIKSFPSFNLSHSYRDSQVVIGLKSINFFLCHAQKVQELLINTWNTFSNHRGYSQMHFLEQMKEFVVICSIKIDDLWQ